MAYTDHTHMHTDTELRPPSKGKMVPVSSLKNLLGRIIKIQRRGRGQYSQRSNRVRKIIYHTSTRLGLQSTTDTTRNEECKKDGQPSTVTLTTNTHKQNKLYINKI